MSKTKPQSTLTFPARKNAARATSLKSPFSSSSKKKSQPSTPSPQSLPRSSPTSATDKADQDDVQVVATRSSPRSAPLVRTTSKSRTTDVRAGLLPQTWLDASDNEVLLRQFDLDYAYGPCGGLSRRARWKRAEKMGLSPPEDVWAILSQLDEEADEAGEAAEVSEEVRRSKRRKFDVDSHSLFENVTARILEAEGRAPP